MEHGPEPEAPEVLALALRRRRFKLQVVGTLMLGCTAALLWPRADSCEALKSYVCRTGIAHCARVEIGLASTSDEQCEQVLEREGGLVRPSLYDGLKELVPDLKYTPEEAETIRKSAVEQRDAAMLDNLSG